MSTQEDLHLITESQKQAALIREVASLLGWDRETYMPPQAIHARSEQLAYLSKLAHEKMIAENVWAATIRLNKEKLKQRDQLMVQKLHRTLSKARKLPPSFIEELSRVTTLAHEGWVSARQKKQFSLFQPHLEKIVDLMRKKSEYLGVPGHPYNGLLDEYEEGMTAEQLRFIFRQLKKELVGLLEKIKASPHYNEQLHLQKNLSKEKMQELIADVRERMGLLIEFSRLDVSAHPFTTKIGVNDVRITTRFEENMLFSFTAVVHEAGHALYEWGMPAEETYTVLGEAPSLGLHESQSRLWENVVGKGRPFWGFYYPLFKKAFNLEGTREEWYREINHVEPGMIRVDADEVHYCLHIILRFELELALLEGKIKVKELPARWNELMEELLGITPSHDGEGVLQDIHWSHGSFGYFPTYALGNIYASQLYEAAKKAHPNMEEEMAKGNFITLRQWLKTRVHQEGGKYLADEIVKKACGQGLNPQIYLSYVKKKYGELYEC